MATLIVICHSCHVRLLTRDPNFPFHNQQDRIHDTMFKYLVSILLLVSQVAALHFYLEGDQQRCFYEELPKGTLVVGE